MNNYTNNDLNLVFSKLPNEIIVAILTKYSRYCIVRDNKLVFLKRFHNKRLEYINSIISKIPKPRYFNCPGGSLAIQYYQPNIVSLDICARHISYDDIQNENVWKYLETYIDKPQEAVEHDNNIYIHKTYTVHNHSDFFTKHTRRLCILYFYGKDGKYPYSRTFSLPASELDNGFDVVNEGVSNEH